MAEAIETVIGRHPDVAFAILEDIPDVVAGQAIGLCIQIDAPVAHVQESAIEGAYPQRAVAVPEQMRGLEVRNVRGEGILDDLVVDESLEAVALRDQEHAIVSLDEPLGAFEISEGVLCRTVRRPAPETCLRPDPHVSGAILVHRACAPAELPFSP